MARPIASKPASSRVKRALDIVLSLTALIAVLPLTLILLFIVRCSRPGAIVRSQNLVGLEGRAFKAWCWSIPVQGRLLWSEGVLLNELGRLPALINVLVGDMALVGPPARTLQQHIALGIIAPGYRRVLDTRPGVIGVSSTERLGSGRAAQLRRELDYVENWRLATDAAVITRWAMSFSFENSSPS
jgi:exopolysaccharide production protein ExoY